MNNLRIKLGLWMSLLSIALLVAGDARAQGFVQKFQNAGCALVVPDSLKHSQKLIDTKVGKIQYHTYYCEQSLGKSDHSAVFQFSYCEYPPVMEMTTGLQDSLLRETIHSSVKNLNGVLVYRDQIEIESSSGYLWRINYNRGNAVMKSKAVFRGRKFYIVQVATMKKNAIDETVRTFLDSFHFL